MASCTGQEFTDSSGQLLDVVKYNPITEKPFLEEGQLTYYLGLVEH